MDMLIGNPLLIVTQVIYVVSTVWAICSLLKKANEYKELLMSKEKTILEQDQAIQSLQKGKKRQGLVLRRMAKIINDYGKKEYLNARADQQEEDRGYSSVTQQTVVMNQNSEKIISLEKRVSQLKTDKTLARKQEVIRNLAGQLKDKRETIAGLHDEIEKKEASHKKELKEGKIVIKDLTNIIGGKNEEIAVMKNELATIWKQMATKDKMIAGMGNVIINQKQTVTKLDILVVTRKTQVSKEIQTEFTVMTDEATDIESLPTTSDEGIGNDSADDVSEEILLSGRVKALKALFEELVH